MVNDNDDDGEGAEKIETRLALAIAEARVDSEPEGRCNFGGRLLNGRSVAGACLSSSPVSFAFVGIPFGLRSFHLSIGTEPAQLKAKLGGHSLILTFLSLALRRDQK